MKLQRAVILFFAVMAMLIVWRAQDTEWKVWADGTATLGVVVAAALIVQRNIRTGQYRLPKRP